MALHAHRLSWINEVRKWDNSQVAIFDFMSTVPPSVRLIIAVVLTVGITLLAVKLAHPRIVALSEGRGKEYKERRRRKQSADGQVVPAAESAQDTLRRDEDGERLEPGNLAGRVLGLCATAFVFLLAFTLGNFWSNAGDAQSAVRDEASAYTRALDFAQELPTTGYGPSVVAALQSYQNSVRNVEWPLMSQADSEAAYQAHDTASRALATAVRSAEVAGAQQQPGWSSFTSAVSAMTSSGTDRINSVPSPWDPGVIALIFILGLGNLALAAAFQPAGIGANLFLMGMMAAITALLLFILVEAANPFLGAASLHPPAFGG